MNDLPLTKYGNELILAARFLLVLLFLIFGFQKVTDFSGTVSYMQAVGAPLPVLATIIAIIMEVFVSLAILIGVLTRPLAALMCLYTLGTALIGHHYWTMMGMARYEAEINFFKNISIIGGFVLLYVTGAGTYSLDAKRKV